MYVAEQVQKTLKKYKTRNPFSICEQKNIEIIYADLEPDVRGFYQYYKRKSIIHLNCNISEEEQYIVLAHELGHVIMHKDYNCIFLSRYTYMTKDIYEHQANLFAAELLLPDEVPIEYQELSYQQLAMLYLSLIHISPPNRLSILLFIQNEMCFFSF